MSTHDTDPHDLDDLPDGWTWTYSGAQHADGTRVSVSKAGNLAVFAKHVRDIPTQVIAAALARVRDHARNEPNGGDTEVLTTPPPLCPLRLDSDLPDYASTRGVFEELRKTAKHLSFAHVVVTGTQQQQVEGGPASTAGLVMELHRDQAGAVKYTPVKARQDAWPLLTADFSHFFSRFTIPEPTDTKTDED